MKDPAQAKNGSQPAEQQRRLQSVESKFIKTFLAKWANTVHDAGHYSEIHYPLVLINATEQRNSCMLFVFFFSFYPTPLEMCPQWIRNVQP